MLRSAYLSLVLSLFFSFSSSFAKIYGENLLHPKQQTKSLSSQEMRWGRHVDSLYSDLNKNKNPKKSDYLFLAKKENIPIVFQTYLPFFQNIKFFHLTNKDQRYNQYCVPQKNAPILLEKAFIQYCLSQYLGKSLRRIYVLKETYPFLLSTFSYILEDNHLSKKWITAFNKLKKHPSLLSFLSSFKNEHFQHFLADQSKKMRTKIARYQFNKYFKRIAHKLKRKDYDLRGELHSLERLVRIQGFPGPQDRYWRKYIALGNDLLVIPSQKKAAEELFKTAFTFAPQEQQEDAPFYLLWPKLYHEDFKGALKIVQQHDLLSQYEHFSSRAQFWISYSIYQNKNKKLSGELFEKIINQHPLSFYSVLSFKLLYKKSPPEKQDQIFDLLSISAPEGLGSALSLSSPTFQAQNVTPQGQLLLKEVLLWNQLKNEPLLSDTLQRLFSLTPSLFYQHAQHKNAEQFFHELVQFLAKEMGDQKEYLHTFKMVYMALEQSPTPLDPQTLKHLFPFAYYNSIKQATADNLNPILVLSLIRQESAFNPKAKSSAGARGLMQLLPQTARSMKKRVHPKLLKRPEINIRLGVKYLSKLLKAFDGNLIHTLAAYNAGPHRLQEWRQHVFKSDNPLLTIEMIPYRETRKYVKLIYRNIFFYQLLSNELEALTRPLQETFSVSYHSPRMR